MESLTSNLKEKEDNINHLNEMIDSYEKIINEQDNIIEIKNQRIKLLENILIKNNLSFPKDTIIQTNLYNNKDNNPQNEFNANLISDDFNENEKIKIKFSNTDNNDNEKEINNRYKVIENNDALREENIEKDNNTNNINDNKESKTEFPIINNSSIKKTNIDEIPLENFEKYDDYDDNENFNVVISGTLLKSNNNKPKEIITNKEIKSSKNLSSACSNIQESDNEKTKISKNSDSDNNLYLIESKDKISFIVNYNNNEKKKNIIKIKTPNISPKSRSKTKTQFKINKRNTSIKKKK